MDLKMVLEGPRAGKIADHESIPKPKREFL